MSVSKRDFLKKLGILSTGFLAGCADRSPSEGTNNSSTATTIERSETPEISAQNLTIINATSNSHTIGIKLGTFESTPDGPGTAVESGEFVLNDSFELSQSETIELKEYRTPGEHYDFLMSVDGNVVLEDLLNPNEGIEIRILDSESVDVERTVV